MNQIVHPEAWQRAWPVELPDRRALNEGLEAARNVTLLSLLGLPRGDLGPEAREPANPGLRALLGTGDVGPFAATGLRPALVSLRAVLLDVRAADARLHGALGRAEMLACRWARGSSWIISPHAWGAAVDLWVDVRGVEATRGAALELSRHFRRHGWYWGAAFGEAHALHFEASDQLLRRWAAGGQLGEDARAASGVGLVRGLALGDRGPAVEGLQLGLNRELGARLAADGRFGPLTHAAVVLAQARAGLRPDGVAGRATLAALGLDARARP